MEISICIISISIELFPKVGTFWVVFILINETNQRQEVVASMAHAKCTTLIAVFSGPIYARDFQAVLERYRVENEHLGCFPLNLDPQPLDNNNYFDVDHIEYV